MRIRQRHTHGLRDKPPYTLPAQTLYKEKEFYNQIYEKVRIRQTTQTLNTLTMQLSARTQIDKKMIETKWRPHANITLGSLQNSRLDQLKIIQGYSSCSLCKVKLKGHSPSTFGKANSPPCNLMLKRAKRKYQDRVSRPKVKNKHHDHHK